MCYSRSRLYWRISMTETGEYCVRCYASRGLDVCKECVIGDLGFTQRDVAALRDAICPLGENSDYDYEELAERIEALLPPQP